MNLDPQILTACAKPRSAREIATLLGVKPALAMRRLYRLRHKGLLVSGACGAVAKRRTTRTILWWTPQTLPAARRYPGVLPSTWDAVLGALGAEPVPTSHVARLALVHDDTARAALVDLVKAGVAVHTKGAKKTSPHLWALAPETT